MDATIESRARRSARSTWARVIALLAILFLITGGGSLALGERQAEDFSSTASRSEAELGTLAMLQRSIIEALEVIAANVLRIRSTVVWTIVITAPAVKCQQIAAGMTKRPRTARINLLNAGADFAQHHRLARAIGDLRNGRRAIWTHHTA